MCSQRDNFKVRIAGLLICLVFVLFTGDTDCVRPATEGKPQTPRHLFKRRSSLSGNANDIVTCGNDQYHSDTVVNDGPCWCTYHEDSRQLSCTGLASFSALIGTVNAPRSWCRSPSSSVDQNSSTSSDFRNVRRLFIGRSRLANFTFDVLKRFDSLNVLTINCNDFDESGGPMVVDGFQLTTLVELDLSDNYNLRQLRPRLLTTFPRLQTLRLDGNNLTNLGLKFFSNDIVPDLRSISMKRNPWHCQEMAWFIDWLRFDASPSVVLEDSALTECQSCEVRQQVTCFLWITWDNFIERCPRNCTCFMVRANVAVDCRNRGYNDFPAVVPSDVGILYMQNNSVRNLHALKNVSSGYHNIRYLYLDNNSIDSINGLDGTNFEELTTLHLNDNRLRQLSIHVFEKLFARNLDEVKLGNNPWNCECNTVVPFNDLLNGRRKRFKDIEQIRCSSNSTLHPKQPIHRLSPSDFCTQTSSVHPLDVINVLLAVLIVVIASKLLYDYRAFKRTGQIPICPVLNVCGRKPG